MFIYGIIWGGRECKQTLRKEKWNISAGLKQLKIAKRKVELKLKEEDVPGAILYLERKKNRRMHRETALEMISSPGSQNN